MVIDTESHIFYRVFPRETNPTRMLTFRMSWHEHSGDLFAAEMEREIAHEDPGDPEQFLIHLSSPSPEALPDHALRSGCDGFVQIFQRLFRCFRHQQLLATLRRQEAALGRVVDELDHPVPETFDVEQAERDLGIAPQS